MRLESQWVKISRDGAEMTGYQVRPEGISESLPGVLVIQEVWGPDEHIQDVADRFAMAGYQALAPDLYSRGGRPEALSEERIAVIKELMEKMPPTAWQNADQRNEFLRREAGSGAAHAAETMEAIFRGRDMHAMVQDLLAWAEYLKGQSRGVASVGYCLGGQLSFLLATEWPDLKAAAVYYGNAPEPEALDRIGCPVQGFYGRTDHRITDPVPEVATEMAARGKVFVPHIYDSAGHAFFNDSRASYAVDAARDAWARTLEFFAECL